jgi:TolB-like protein/class 3 adenylate cyclase
MTSTRRLAAILAADVAGYSWLVGADEEGTLNRLRSIRAELIDPNIGENRGRIVKTTGDGLLVEFSSVVDALRCATEWQAAMADHPEPGDNRIEFRIGVHQGDIVVDDGDIFGDGVNVAARLEGLAEPGGICVSARVQEDAAGKLDLAFEDMGEQRLKNIARPVRVYRVRPGTTDNAPKVTREGPALALPDKPSIAVLPFANMSGDPEQEYFADGMVEEIITALSRIRWLFVIARNSTFTYKGKAVDVKQVARELGVRYVLEGSVRKAGNQVRITGQLIDSSTAAHIWADRFDGLLDDVFKLQDKVASGVVGAIEPKLRQSEIERAIRKPTESLDAYDLYLRALALRDSHTDESVSEAITLAKQALVIDPTYAPAAALIGWSRIHQLSHGRRPVSEVEVAEAVTFAKRAIDYGPDDPDVLWMAAATLLIFTGNRSTAAALSERALAINPNSALAWMARGWSSFGQPDLAIEALERAMRLSPLDRLARTFGTGIAHAHIAAGRYEQALDWAERALRIESDYSGGLITKAIACTQLGRIEEAHAAIQQITDANPWRTAGRINLFSRLFPPEVAAICIESLRKAGFPE